MDYKGLLVGTAVIMLLMSGAYYLIAPKAELSLEAERASRLESRTSNTKTTSTVTEQTDTVSTATTQSEILADADVEEVSPVVALTPEKTPTQIPEPTPEQPVSEPTQDRYTLAEVALHADATSCWTAIDGEVYDLTPFLKLHPGGIENIMKICGIDGSEQFSAQHDGQRRPEQNLEQFYIGNLIQ